MKCSIFRLAAAVLAGAFLAGVSSGQEGDEKQEGAGKAEKAEKGEKPETSESGEKDEKPEKPEKADKPEKAEPEKTAPPARPAFPDLLKLNEASIFGGTVMVAADDSFEVVFNKAGQMARGFDGALILDQNSPGAQGANRRFYTHEVDKKQVPIENLSGVGIPPQGSSAFTTWTSRFPVGGDVKVSFVFRIPNLMNQQSDFVVRLYAVKDTYLENRFFTVLTKAVGGKVVGKAATPIKEYARPASKWFPRSEPQGVPVEITAAGGKCQVKMKNQDLVALNKVGEMPAGKVVFGFSKLVFTMQDLHIQGKLDRKWAEAQIADLEKRRMLILKPPEVPKDEVAPAAPPPAEGKKTEP